MHKHELNHVDVIIRITQISHYEQEYFIHCTVKVLNISLYVQLSMYNGGRSTLKVEIVQVLHSRFYLKVQCVRFTVRFTVVSPSCLVHQMIYSCFRH